MESFFVVLFLFGLMMGSFLNVLIYRMPRGESIVLPPSHCPNCQHRLLFWDLLPVVSYLLLGAKCRYCQARISPRYPCVELMTAGLTLACGLKFGLDMKLAVFLLFTYALVVIFFIDLDHQLILDRLTLPLIFLGLVYRLWQGGLWEGIWGGLIAGGVLAVVVWLYPKGLGLGDAKFLALSGVWLGWQKAFLALFFGSLLGTFIIVPMIGIGKWQRREPIPFGPFLVTGVILVLYLGDYLPQFLRF